MIINEQSLDTFKRVAVASYNAGLASAMAESVWSQYAEKLTIGTKKAEAGWLGSFPQLKPWEQGSSKVYESLDAYAYDIEPRNFAAGFQCTRDEMEDAADDPAVAAMQLGMATLMRRAGESAGEFYDVLCAEALANGHLTTHPTLGHSIACHDDKAMFDAAHPNGSEQGDFSNEDTSGGVSNPYFLIDPRRKPVLLVERKAPTIMFNTDGDQAFDKGIWQVAVEARAEAGYTLPQFAFRSTASISLANYRAHKTTMKGYVSDRGHKLNIRPRLILTGDSNEDAIMDLFTKPTLATGETNMGTMAGVSILHVPFLD